jgi:hypothetical protein
MVEQLQKDMQTTLAKLQQFARDARSNKGKMVLDFFTKTRQREIEELKSELAGVDGSIDAAIDVVRDDM